MIEWGKVAYFLMYITISQIGNYLDQDSRYYTCPCYCEAKHTHVRREDDRCEQTVQMVIQDSCAVYIVYYDDLP